MRFSLYTLSLVGLLLAPLSNGAEVKFPGKPAGKAKAEETKQSATLSNRLLKAEFSSKNGVMLTKLTTADGKPIVQPGTPLFTIKLGNGKELTQANFTCSGMSIEKLKPNKKAVKLSERKTGQSISANFVAPDKSFTVKWSAVLRNGSHYLRQELDITANKDVRFDTITPLQYNVALGNTPTLSGNTTHGKLVVNDQLFLGLETPMSLMSAGNQGIQEKSPKAWTPDSFESVFALSGKVKDTYGEQFKEKVGPIVKNIVVADMPIEFAKGGECKLTFQYRKGNKRLDILGVQLVDEKGSEQSADMHTGFTGHKQKNNTYTIHVPKAGNYTLRYWADTRDAAVNCHGEVAISLPQAEKKQEKNQDNLVKGQWVRKTTLKKGDTWHIGSVIGFLAPQQARRSFLAYNERERAHPYRQFIHYNDWYEVGIRINNNPDPAKRNNEKIQLDILEQWNKNLFQKHNISIDCFVIDDGWDEFNSLWEFHVGFPNGFKRIDQKAAKQNAGIGTWLGPVGGYGGAKEMRLANWNRNHPHNKIDNFELSNPIYFDAFLGRCKYMVENYDMRYFKFDGISAQTHAKGPAGLEDAEGIINVIRELRKARPDLFINTTVGTWASPFWFHVSDCVWRQEQDFEKKGSMGDPRDKWITYRDNLVYEVFVQGAPLCPINTIMTHGTIITRRPENTPPDVAERKVPPCVMSTDPANCIKEMRAAFGSGSGLQELYVDYELMNQQDGRLWKELADCIRWIRKHEDVMADIHWVGGKPWNGNDGSIYGWAAWAPGKCTLTLRNSSNKPKTLKTTLRKLLDIPPAVRCNVKLNSAFEDQRKLSIVDKFINADEEIEIEMQPMEVIVMDGITQS